MTTLSAVMRLINWQGTPSLTHYPYEDIFEGRAPRQYNFSNEADPMIEQGLENAIITEEEPDYSSFDLGLISESKLLRPFVKESEPLEIKVQKNQMVISNGKPIGTITALPRHILFFQKIHR